jgi:hypothetical protein
MTESMWETFDALFKTIHRQGRRVEELEQRLLELDRRLDERRLKIVAPNSNSEEPTAQEKSA